MKVKGALTSLVLGALSLTCDAGELVLHSFSWHSKYNKDVTTTRMVWEDYMWVERSSTTLAYNNRNFGLGWRTDSGVIFGAYHNSYYRPTVYLGREFMVNRHFGAFVGLATGYRHPITPIGGLIAEVPERAAMEVIGSPRVGNTDGVIHLAVSYRF